MCKVKTFNYDVKILNQINIKLMENYDNDNDDVLDDEIPFCVNRDHWFRDFVSMSKKAQDADAKEYISESEKKFFEEHDATKVLNELNNEKEEEKISSNDLENSIKDEVRKLDNILSAEENVSASNSNSKVPSNDAIKALTSEDIESLKRELIRRQEEERRIREISESRKQENN